MENIRSKAYLVGYILSLLVLSFSVWKLPKVIMASLKLLLIASKNILLLKYLVTAVLIVLRPLLIFKLTPYILFIMGIVLIFQIAVERKVFTHSKLSSLFNPTVATPASSLDTSDTSIPTLAQSPRPTLKSTENATPKCAEQSSPPSKKN